MSEHPAAPALPPPHAEVTPDVKPQSLKKSVTSATASKPPSNSGSTAPKPVEKSVKTTNAATKVISDESVPKLINKKVTTTTGAALPKPAVSKAGSVAGPAASKTSVVPATTKSKTSTSSHTGESKASAAKSAPADPNKTPTKANTDAHSVPLPKPTTPAVGKIVAPKAAVAASTASHPAQRDADTKKEASATKQTSKGLDDATHNKQFEYVDAPLVAGVAKFLHDIISGDTAAPDARHDSTTSAATPLSTHSAKPVTKISADKPSSSGSTILHTKSAPLKSTSPKVSPVNSKATFAKSLDTEPRFTKQGVQGPASPGLQHTTKDFSGDEVHTGPVDPGEYIPNSNKNSYLESENTGYYNQTSNVARNLPDADSEDPNSSSSVLVPAAAGALGVATGVIGAEGHEYYEGDNQDDQNAEDGNAEDDNEMNLNELANSEDDGNQDGPIEDVHAGNDNFISSDNELENGNESTDANEIVSNDGHLETNDGDNVVDNENDAADSGSGSGDAVKGYEDNLSDAGQDFQQDMGVGSENLLDSENQGEENGSETSADAEQVYQQPDEQHVGSEDQGSDGGQVEPPAQDSNAGDMDQQDQLDQDSQSIQEQPGEEQSDQGQQDQDQSAQDETQSNVGADETQSNLEVQSNRDENQANGSETQSDPDETQSNPDEMTQSNLDETQSNPDADSGDE
ncbi:MAG: hypothetical protein MMC33_002640 [Icmadophila ericetorum]|nr:hypothetical protein [Icmadophila ericetorum]